MNRAEAVIFLGFGCYQWRTDIQLPTSVLALELQRDCPLARKKVGAKPLVHCPTVRRPCKKSAPGALLFDANNTENQEIAASILKVLRKSWATRQKLHFWEVFEQLGLHRGAYRRALRIMKWLTQSGQAREEKRARRKYQESWSGQRRGTVYWAEG